MKTKLLILSVLTFCCVFTTNAQNEWNFSNSPFVATTYTSTTTIEGLTIMAGETTNVIIDANSKKNGTNTFSLRLKLGGPGEPVWGTNLPTTRSLVFDVSGPCQIIMACRSSSNSSDRRLLISNGTDLLGYFSAYGTYSDSYGNTVPMDMFNYTGNAGKIYLYSQLNGVNIYYLKVQNPVSVDNEAPSIPGGLLNTTPTPNSFTLSWNPSKDNFAVTGYDVFKDGTLYGSTSTTNLYINNLLVNSSYSMTVVSKDAAGNKSIASSPLVVNTNLITRNSWTDELDGSTLGNSVGISYTTTPNGKGAVLSKNAESRIEYPFSIGLPHEGTIEMLINVSKGYYYNNYLFYDSQPNAYIFNTGSSDVWNLGAMWLIVNDNGDVSIETALTTAPTLHALLASFTTFRFNQWHLVSFSYGNQGQYLKVDDQLVASNQDYNETLQTCGDWGSNRDVPTIGEEKSVFWNNNQNERGFEGILDRFRVSNIQKDWVLVANNNTNNTTSKVNEPFEKSSSTKIYPNPVFDKLTIESKGNPVNSNFEITNSTGQIVSFGKLSDRTIINTANLIHGVYIIRLNFDKNVEFKKFIKK